jgi:hypothetical protein
LGPTVGAGAGAAGAAAGAAVCFGGWALRANAAEQIVADSTAQERLASKERSMVMNTLKKQLVYRESRSDVA